MSRLRDLVGLGIGHTDARHWHKKVYSGMVSVLSSLSSCGVRGSPKRTHSSFIELH